MSAGVSAGGHFTHDGDNRHHSDIVLACLILALECEDEANEARALGRGKTPDRRSAR